MGERLLPVRIQRSLNAFLGLGREAGLLRGALVFQTGIIFSKGFANEMQLVLISLAEDAGEQMQAHARAHVKRQVAIHGVG